VTVNHEDSASTDPAIGYYILSIPSTESCGRSLEVRPSKNYLHLSARQIFVKYWPRFYHFKTI